MVMVELLLDMAASRLNHLEKLLLINNKVDNEQSERLERTGNVSDLQVYIY